MKGDSVLFRNIATHLPKYPPTTYHPTTHLTYLPDYRVAEHRRPWKSTTEHSRNSNVRKLSHLWAPFYLTTFISCGSTAYSKLLDKPTDISTCHTTRLFLTVFTRPQLQTLSRAGWVLLTFSHAIHFHLKIEPYSHLHLGLVRGHLSVCLSAQSFSMPSTELHACYMLNSAR